jgi:hypothetical protein
MSEHLPMDSEKKQMSRRDQGCQRNTALVKVARMPGMIAAVAAFRSRYCC